MTSLTDPAGWGFTDSSGTDAMGVGPQTDGTVIPPPTAVPTQPVDAGGGAPANYPQAILDIFKVGVGAYVQTQQQQQQFQDYRAYQATRTGLFQQGKPAQLAAASTGGVSGTVIMAGVAILAVALILHRS